MPEKVVWAVLLMAAASGILFLSDEPERIETVPAYSKTYGLAFAGDEEYQLTRFSREERGQFPRTKTRVTAGGTTINVVGFHEISRERGISFIEAWASTFESLCLPRPTPYHETRSSPCDQTLRPQQTLADDLRKEYTLRSDDQGNPVLRDTEPAAANMTRIYLFCERYSSAFRIDIIHLDDTLVRVECRG